MACDVEDSMLLIHLMVMDMVNGVFNGLSRKSVHATFATLLKRKKI